MKKTFQVFLGKSKKTDKKVKKHRKKRRNLYYNVGISANSNKIDNPHYQRLRYMHHVNKCKIRSISHNIRLTEHQQKKLRKRSSVPRGKRKRLFYKLPRANSKFLECVGSSKPIQERICEAQKKKEREALKKIEGERQRRKRREKKAQEEGRYMLIDDFFVWKQLCYERLIKKLPFQKVSQLNKRKSCKKSKKSQKVRTSVEFYKTIEECIEVMEQAIIEDPTEKKREHVGMMEHAILEDYLMKKGECWLSNNVPNFDRNVFYAKRMIVNPKSKIAIIGDRHGAIENFNEILANLIEDGYLDNSLKIIKDDFFMIFLGDYVDRALNGAEVLYVLMQLKIQNPDKVTLLRGNHEAIWINKLDDIRCGFAKELKEKYGMDHDFLLDRIERFYKLLPVALFLGSGLEGQEDFALFCHGGLEPRFDPRKLFGSQRKLVMQEIKTLDANWLGPEMIKKLEGFMPSGFKPRELVDIGFVNNYFVVNEEETGDIVQESYVGRCAFNKNISLEILDKYGVRVMFRGHQHHNDFLIGQMLKKLIINHGMHSAWSEKQWDGKSKYIKLIEYGPVWTLIVAPEGYKKVQYDFDTYVILHVGKTFDQWRLEPRKIPYKKNK